MSVTTFSTRSSQGAAWTVSSYDASAEVNCIWSLQAFLFLKNDFTVTPTTHQSLLSLAALPGVYTAYDNALRRCDKAPLQSTIAHAAVRPYLLALARAGVLQFDGPVMMKCPSFPHFLPFY